MEWTLVIILYQCICKNGDTGKNCETSTKLTYQLLVIILYQCICKNGHTGKHYETSKKVT